MIALLICCGNSYCQSNNTTHFSTGDVKSDSVLVSYNDLRIANAKMTELKYEKEINKDLKKALRNDSILLVAQDYQINLLLQKNKKVKKQRNIFMGVSGTVIAGIIAALLFK